MDQAYYFANYDTPEKYFSRKFGVVFEAICTCTIYFIVYMYLLCMHTCTCTCMTQDAEENFVGQTPVYHISFILMLVIRNELSRIENILYSCRLL